MMKHIIGAALLAVPSVAGAQAVISNGTVGLGVDRGGQLNIGSTNRSTGGTFNYGLRDIATNYEATAQGCLCEGWGAGIAGRAGTAVYANNAAGNSYDVVSFVSTATTATSVVRSRDGSLEVTHAYSPSASSNLYQVDVSIKNISGVAATGNTLYRRAMDWDIEPTPFAEYSTIQGTAGAANVLYASDNGFASSNPFDLSGRTPLVGGAVGDFVDSGPGDHGALFDFAFAPLSAGASQNFTVFFGSANSETSALAALGAVGAEVYSLGQSSDNRLGTTAGRANFIFGFKGVGGTAVAAVPEPATWAMMLLGFGMVGAAARRRRSAVQVRFA